MRFCWSQWLLIAVVVVFGSFSMLAGCGQKGDLYLPEKTLPKKTLPEKTEQPRTSPDK